MLTFEGADTKSLMYLLLINSFQLGVSMSVNNENLVWIDMEMTGLEPETDVVLEIATIVTDKNLNILAEGPVLAIYQPDEVLNGMDQWCTDTHGKSGLTKRCRDSDVNEQQAVEQTILFLKVYLHCVETQ